MTMVRDLFGRKIEFKPIEDFDDDEIWETADGERIPIVYLSDRHLKNAVRRFEELVSDVEEMRDFAPERDQTWAEQKVEEEELMQKEEIETIAEMIRKLKADGITLEEVAEELNYRDNANDSKWDDNLFEYSTEELELIEQFWDAGGRSC